MSSIWSRSLKISIFGESHGPAIGTVLDGLPSGFAIDINSLRKEMQRRAPGHSDISTSRKEIDEFELLSGYFEGKTTGTPLTAIIRNTDMRSNDYNDIKKIMRPSHADYTGFVRYDGNNDYRGSGHFSGRITAPLVLAGSICRQILETKGIYIGSHIKSVGDIEDRNFEEFNITKSLFNKLSAEQLPLLEKSLFNSIEDMIYKAKREGDSIGGVVECCVIGMRAGIGDPFFDSVESVLSHLMFSVPSVKGVEFGAGFDITKMTGSQANDSLYYDEDEIKTRTNYNGGVVGGITNGMPIVFRVAIKPTPSISKPQETVDIVEEIDRLVELTGRHDPIIVPRAIPVIEAATAIGILDLMMSRMQ